LSEPNMLNPYVFLVKKLKILSRFTGESPTESAFFRWSLKSMLQSYGFREIVVKPFDFLHPNLPASLVRFVDAVGRFLERTPMREFAGSLFISGEK